MVGSNMIYRIVKAIPAVALGFAMTTGLHAADDAKAKVPEVCVVNGDKFAERKNPPITVSHNGESIVVCCKKCSKKFEKEPDKYIKLYKEALAKEGKATS